jgi:hypothetical protein
MHIARFADVIQKELQTTSVTLIEFYVKSRRIYLCGKERFLAVWYTKCPQI